MENFFAFRLQRKMELTVLALIQDTSRCRPPDVRGPRAAAGSETAVTRHRLSVGGVGNSALARVYFCRLLRRVF